MSVTTAYSESSTARVPGRSWTVRLTGHADHSATVSCSTAACRMPRRSKDLASLRAFAARHAAAHARAATIRPNASCHCRAEQCGAHQDTRVQCAGSVVMILRHDPAVGRVWTAAEVCAGCAPLLPHATVVADAPRPRPTASAAAQSAPRLPTARTATAVPGGFSSPGTPGADNDAGAARRHRHGVRGPRRRSGQP
ncbi:hypothetical protein QMZ92_09945 [Streptomyces sp. HNM0645]|uniref:hypothetical protein n=1 Tax=Streptomyces sp. HNM0645 TaxID=2782343 RepID=UPI0024B79883|nr:hypothetical protein [Streptomyces sp. HNM0645]MDI9884707.1 hypothetical protein [Streptomyces sp. HNM0645]